MEIAQHQKNRFSGVHGKGLALIVILVEVAIVVSGWVSMSGSYQQYTFLTRLSKFTLLRRLEETMLVFSPSGEDM